MEKKITHRMIGPDGVERDYALVPLEESAFERNPGLMARIGTRFKSWFTKTTSDADDEGTTDMGVRASAIRGEDLMQSMWGGTGVSADRASRYRDFEKINKECVELNRALQVTVDNVFTSRDGDQETYKLNSKSAEIKTILEGVDERVGMQEELPRICKSGLKYGDEFEEIVYNEEFLTTRLKWLNPNHMVRNEDKFGRLEAKRAFTQKLEGSSETVEFPAWQVIHWRHWLERGNQYGTSFFETARKPWRQLVVGEDGALLTMLTHTDRDVIMVPMPKGASIEDQKKLLSQTRESLKRRRYVDSNGKVDWRKAPLADAEDLFIPTNAENPARVDRMQASNVSGRIPILEYFQNKMLIAPGVPKSYLGLERDVNSKATLSWQDLQYARILRSIQKEMAWFQREVYDRQLVQLQKTPEKDLYEIVYPPISFVDEEMKMSVEQMKWGIAGSAKQSFGMPTLWLLTNIVKIPKEEAEVLSAQIDAEKQAQQQAFGQPPEQPWGGQQGQFMSQAMERSVRDTKLARSIQELRDMILYIRKHKLNEEARL